MDKDKIEELLNAAGNTMEDIEQRNTSITELKRAEKAAKDWYVEHYGNGYFDTSVMDAEYICYLSGIIDRLEWALRNTLIRSGVNV